MAQAATSTKGKSKSNKKSGSGSSAMTRRRPETVSKKKYEDLQARAKRLAAKAREAATMSNTQEDALIAVGSAMLLAAAEREGKELPTIAGLDPALVYGVLGAVVAPQFVDDPQWSQRLESAGVGLLTVAAHRSLMRGSVKMAEAPAEEKK
jgi:hypothetical protein